MEIEPCRFNLDFEKTLRRGRRSSNPSTEWDSVFFFLSRKKECLVTQKDFSQDFLKFLKNVWGLSPNICSSNGYVRDWWGKTDNLERERCLNSKVEARRFCLWAKRDTDFPSQIVSNEQELSHVFQEISGVFEKVLLKPPFGFSGKKNTILSSKSSSEKLQKMASFFFESSDSFLVEPWVERCLDFRYRVTEVGVDQVAQTLIHPKGNFVGLTDMPENQRDQIHGLVGESLAREMKTFFGDNFPFQGDGFFYKNQKGEIKIRQVSEFNHRRSLGEMLFRCRELTESQDQKCSWVLLPNPQKYDRFDQLFKELSTSGLKEKVLPTSDEKGFFLTFFVKTSPADHLKVLKKLYQVMGADFPSWLLNQFSTR